MKKEKVAETAESGSECLVPNEWRWYQPGQSMMCKQVMLPLFVVTGLLALALLTQIIVLVRSGGGGLIDWVLAGVALLMFLLMTQALVFVKRSLLVPLFEIRQWVSNVERGDLSARMPAFPEGEFNNLAQDINRLAQQVETLNRNFADEVSVQTESLARKTQALELLYEVVTSANEGDDINHLLSHFMQRLGSVYDADAVLVRGLVEGQLWLVDSYGLHDDSPFLNESVPIRTFRQSRLFGRDGIDVRSETINEYLSDHSRGASGQSGIRQIVSIPLQYRDSVLGCYQLFVDASSTFDSENRKLLLNIGQHLGAVLQQSRLNEGAGKLIMVEERTRIANELHDSLAQTLASIRFQVRVLDETLHQGDEQVTWEELEKLQGQVDEANKELRSLIGQFRAPLRSEEVVVSVKKLIEKFRQNTGVTVFLQNEWSDDDLTTQMRTDVIRIVQEALANIRKHAEANTVRVLLRHKGSRYRIMIEDDGRGFDGKPTETSDDDSQAGEHIGQTIMMERAKNLGSELKLESEPDEGCVVSLEFEYTSDSLT